MFELAANQVRILDESLWAHFAAAARAFEGIAAPDVEDALTPATAGPVRCDGRRVKFEIVALWRLLSHASGFVAVETVVAEGLEAFGRDVFVEGGDEVGAGEELKVPLGAPAAGGAVENGLGLCVPGHFLEGYGRSEEVLSQPFDGLAVVGADGGFSLIDVEAMVLPSEQLVGLSGRDPLEVQQSVEDFVAENLGELLATGAANEVELEVCVKDASGGEAMNVWMVGEVVAEGVDGEDDSGSAIGDA